MIESGQKLLLNESIKNNENKHHLRVLLPEPLTYLCCHSVLILPVEVLSKLLFPRGPRPVEAIDWISFGIGVS
jgi:hypothetical protein